MKCSAGRHCKNIIPFSRDNITGTMTVNYHIQEKNMKTKQRLPRKKHPYLNTAKAVLLVLTAIYPVFMVMMTGAGICYNSGSYGAAFTRYGIILIASGAMMTGGAVLCLFRKNIPNLIAPFLSSGGFITCMAILSRLVKRAKANGWHGSGMYEGVTASYIFQSRLIPCILPVALTITIALCQYFSYDLGEVRRERRQARNERENAPSPSIID